MSIFKMKSISITGQTTTLFHEEKEEKEQEGNLTVTTRTKSRNNKVNFMPILLASGCNRFP
ncbi:hypothetical protein ACFOU2_22395 [Bacillus songklensis]|uniref:Uncharacterized protein n=1 Tax=Bacillus songklensis TaxID=1069116 RepID=A0ABV8BAA6_9BACI